MVIVMMMVVVMRMMKLYSILHYIISTFRMFHIDDVPSGVGEGIKDIRKALAVGI